MIYYTPNTLPARMSHFHAFRQATIPLNYASTQPNRPSVSTMLNTAGNVASIATVVAALIQYLPKR